MAIIYKHTHNLRKLINFLKFLIFSIFCKSIEYYLTCIYEYLYMNVRAPNAFSCEL